MSRSRPWSTVRRHAWPLGALALPAAAAERAGAAGSSLAWWLLAAAVATLAGAMAVWWRRERRLGEDLQAERALARGLADLLDVWQWRSDASHGLTHWRAPRGSPAADWRRPPPGTCLWDHFRSSGESGLRAVVEAGAPIDDLTVQVTLASGVVTCQLRATALLDAQGRFTGYVGTARPLAGVPVGQPAIAAAARPTVAIAAEDSEQEAFSYTVSHDLRAPIRVVEGFTRILKEDYGRLLDRIGNDHLDRVLAAAARMNSMIDALLALSQLSAQPLARQPVNLSQLAVYVTDDLRRQSPQRQVKVHIEPGLHAPGDPTLLRVVLENLLGNAWKYTAKSSDPQIWFGHDPDQPVDVFTVRDNGAGFDMRFADRLFGVFQRLHSATDFHGTGVGLASVRRIVRRHGGEIWAEGEVDRGARFHFTMQ